MIRQQASTPAFFTVMTAVPDFLAVTCPEELTAATEDLLLLKVIRFVLDAIAIRSNSSPMANDLE